MSASSSLSVACSHMKEQHTQPHNCNSDDDDGKVHKDDKNYFNIISDDGIRYICSFISLNQLLYQSIILNKTIYNAIKINSNYNIWYNLIKHSLVNDKLHFMNEICNGRYGFGTLQQIENSYGIVKDELKSFCSKISFYYQLKCEINVLIKYKKLSKRFHHKYKNSDKLENVKKQIIEKKLICNDKKLFNEYHDKNEFVVSKENKIKNMCECIKYFEYLIQKNKFNKLNEILRELYNLKNYLFVKYLLMNIIKKKYTNVYMENYLMNVYQKVSIILH